MSSPSSLLTVRANSGYIQRVARALSIARLGVGLASFLAPAAFAGRFYGFQLAGNTRTTAGTNASAASTTARAGSPEELSAAVRWFGAREIAFGLLLRDSSSAVLERVLQVGLINSGLDLLAAAGGFFLGASLVAHPSADRPQRARSRARSPRLSVLRRVSWVPSSTSSCAPAIHLAIALTVPQQLVNDVDSRRPVCALQTSLTHHSRPVCSTRQRAAARFVAWNRVESAPSGRSCPLCHARMLPSSRRAFATTAGRAARARQSADPNDPLTLSKQRTLDFDDVPTRMHTELAQDADRLHYHRLIEFEMPQLKRFRRAFEPPPASHVVMSRHVRYHDEPDHPRSRRASLSVDVDALDVSPTERHALIHLAGGRWNGIKRTVTVATSRFPELAQNERWAGDALDRLFEGARQRADQLADLPLDDRGTHARLQRRGRTLTTLRDFPAEWLPDGADVTSRPSLSGPARERVQPQPSQHGVAPSAGDF